MRVLIITSCTGEKAVSDTDAPELSDFKRGDRHIDRLHKELSGVFMPAEQLYTGQQHVRLMSSVDSIRAHDEPSLAIDLFVLSAGYGLVPGERELPPYEITFSGMRKKELREWADNLNIPSDIREVLKQPYDLAFILLGDNYLEACSLDSMVNLGGPTIMFCGKSKAGKLPDIKQLNKIGLGNMEAKRFSCALIGLKGEIVSILLKALNSGDITISKLLGTNQPLDLIDTLRAKK